MYAPEGILGEGPWAVTANSDFEQRFNMLEMNWLLGNRILQADLL